MFFSQLNFGRRALLAVLLAAAVACTALLLQTDCRAAPVKLTSSSGSYVVYTPDFWDLLADYYNATENDYPVIVYLHGGGHKFETAYEPLLRDLAAAGNYVVFPRYEATDRQNAKDFYWRANNETWFALTDLNSTLSQSPLFPPADQLNVAYVGHSLGAMYALQMAHDFSPVVRPRTIVLHDPTGFRSDSIPWGWNISNWLDDSYLSRIPSDTRLVIVASLEVYFSEAGAADLANSQAGGVWARAWHNTPINAGFKNAFVAGFTHQSPSSDYHLYGSAWRVVTLSAIDAAFFGAPFAYYQDYTWSTSFNSLLPPQ